MLFLSACGTMSSIDNALEGVSAQSVVYNRKVYGTSAVITAENYKNTSDKITADKFFIDENFVFGSLSLEIKNFEKIKAKKELENTEKSEKVKE